MSATISVIIPAYNADRFLAAAVESVLAQGVDGLELLVVNDGSRDGTAIVARAFGPPVQVLEQENRGIGPARNTGVNAAAGELLAFLDADDVWAYGSLATRLQMLTIHPDLDGVFGLVENWQDGEAATGLEVKAGATAQGPVAGTMLIRRASFLKAGPFTDVRLGEFIEWYARAVDAGLRFDTVQQVVLRRRIHAASTTATARDRSAYLRAMQSIIARRRAEER
jgi:glycosyltransferase involved in cell wall biosynthesis